MDGKYNRSTTAWKDREVRADLCVCPLLSEHIGSPGGFHLIYELFRNKIWEISKPIQGKGTKKMPLTVDEILKWAIEREDASYKVYKGILDKIEDPGAKAMVSQLAKEELGHKAVLKGMDPSKLRDLHPKKIQDLRIAEYLKDRTVTEVSSLQDVLVFAMKREKEAHEFYVRLAEAVSDPEVKNLLEVLAEEELRHKRDVEAFYDDVIYQED
jgi:rubrerythrin